MIYFIKAGDFIKVGYTKNEKSFIHRVDSYSTSCPFDIELISIIDGGVDLEKDIINYFIKFHQKGEWFRYNESMYNFAINPFVLPKAKIKKPTNISHKIISDNLDKILEDYKNGNSLKIISERFGINRARLTKYIPDELKRKKNEWFSIRKRETNPKNKPIICTTTGEKFNSIKDASRKLGISSICISKVCRGIRKYTHNLKFEFINP